jgi:hypothetical protein
MAVKRYMTNDTAPISLPSPTGSWDVNTATGTSALASAAAGTGAASQGAETSTTNPTTSLARRFVDPNQMLSAGDFGGNWTMVVAANESNAAADCYLRVVIKVVDSTGATTRGSQAFVHGSELTTTNTGYTLTGTISPPIACSVNDRIVVEVGGNFTNTVNTNYQVNIRRGGTAGDLVAGDTGTNANDRSGYITFSDATADARFSSGVSGALAGSAPVPTGAVTAEAADIAVVASYTDTATSGGECEVAVTGVQVGDGLLVTIANAYTDPADAEPASDLAGSWSTVGTAWIGNPEIPTYENQNLATRLFTATAAGTATIDVTESNESVLGVVHLRPRAGRLVVVDTSGDGVAELVVSQSGGGPAAAQAIGPVDATVAGLLVGAWAGIRFAANSWTPPVTMVEQLDLGDGANTQTLMVATEVVTATGDTGTRTSTAALAPSTGFAGRLVALTTITAPTSGALAGSAPVPTGAVTAVERFSGAAAGSAPVPTGAVTAVETIAGAAAGAAPVPTGALAAGQAFTAAAAGSAPVPTGALAAVERITGAAAGAAPRPTGALAGDVDDGTDDATGQLAGSAPGPVGAIAAVERVSGAAAGAAAVPTGALAAVERITGAMAGAAPVPVGELAEGGPAVVGPVRVGSVTMGAAGPRAGEVVLVDARTTGAIPVLIAGPRGQA